MIAKFIIRLIRNTAKVLSSHHSNGDHTFEQHIDPILELKSPLRVKPKDRSPDTKNKKRSQAEAGLDDFTRHKPSRFEYEEGKDTSKNALVKKLDLRNLLKIKKKRQSKGQGGKGSTSNIHSKGGKKGKSIFRARASETPLVSFEKEEESDLIMDTRSSKIDQGATRSVGMSTRSTHRE